MCVCVFPVVQGQMWVCQVVSEIIQWPLSGLIPTIMYEKAHIRVCTYTGNCLNSCLENEILEKLIDTRQKLLIAYIGTDQKSMVPALYLCRERSLTSSGQYFCFNLWSKYILNIVRANGKWHHPHLDLFPESHAVTWLFMLPSATIFH